MSRLVPERAEVPDGAEVPGCGTDPDFGDFGVGRAGAVLPARVAPMASWFPEVCEAAASEPFWINNRGTMSTAPHKMRAAPGRLPFLMLVLRTPLSS